MLKKHSSRSFFSSCCQPQLQEPQIIISPCLVSSSNIQKSDKRSLKYPHSFKTTTSSFKDHNSLRKPISIKSFVYQPISNGNSLMHLNKRPNQTSLLTKFEKILASKRNNQNILHIEDHQRMLPQQNYNLKPKRLFTQKINEQIPIFLQKTAKISAIKNQSFFKQLQELQLSQTKQLSKKFDPLILQKYKQSVVSVNYQCENIQSKMEQSMIILDFFNPSQDRAKQVVTFLENRND